MCRCIWHGGWVGGCSDNSSGAGTLCHRWLRVRCLEGGAFPTANAVQETGLRIIIIIPKYVLQYRCTLFYVQSWPYFLNLLSSLICTCLYVFLLHTIVLNSVVLCRYADCTEALNFIMIMSSLLIDTIQVFFWPKY